MMLSPNSDFGSAGHWLTSAFEKQLNLEFHFRDLTSVFLFWCKGEEQGDKTLYSVSVNSI